MELEERSVLIAGGGPAGCTAAIYLARAAIHNTVVRTVAQPSQISYSEQLENYPGVKSVNGFEFIQALEDQVAGLGGRMVEGQVTGVHREGHDFVAETGEGKTYKACGMIVATGSRSRMLGVPGEKEFRGRGVSYCGTCDGAFFKGKKVVVVGGGDTAAEDGHLLSRLAEKVYLVHRRDRMRAQAHFAQRLLARPNVAPVWNSVVREIEGSETVQSVLVRDVKSGEEKRIETDGVFIFIGGIPNTEVFADLAPMDREGYILTDENMCTETPGFFAAGDCRHKHFRQVVTACADGAIAAYAAQKYIESLEGTTYPGR